MENIQLRAATTADLPTLYAFEQGVVEAERPFNPTLKPGRVHYYDLAAYVVDPDIELLVATIKDEVVASAYAKVKISGSHEQQDAHAYMGFMYVKPEHRGKGINRILVEALMDWVRSRNLKEIRLDVYSENEAAIRAYDKVGFRPLLTKMRMELP